MAQQTPVAPRDEAVQIATAFFNKLFVRAWMTWTDRHAAGITRLIDCIIAAAAERVQQQRDEAFLDELLVDSRSVRSTHPPNGSTVRLRRGSDDELMAEDDPQFQKWQQRQRSEDARRR